MSATLASGSVQKNATHPLGSSTSTTRIAPPTGRPVAHAPASVSVMHPSCAQADVLATVLSVLGVEAGIAYADALELAALFVSRDPAGRMTERVSRAASAMLE